MRSLFRPDDLRAILTRLDQLPVQGVRRWGRMSREQVVCHLSDALRGALGDRAVTPIRSPLLRTVGRVAALSLPVPWPRNAPTAPEYAQEASGTPPTDPGRDMEDLRRLIDRFVGAGGTGLTPHVAFGDLSPAEWGRWGYRHLDHHLRQFGV